jgi:hypothetical protein
MRRREFIGLAGATAVMRPLAVHAQRPSLPVIGFLHSATVLDDALVGSSVFVPTGRIDFATRLNGNASEESDQPNEFKLLVEERRIVESIAANEKLGNSMAACDPKAGQDGCDSPS